MIKNLLKKTFQNLGYEIKKIAPSHAGAANRPPHATFSQVLEDLVARGFQSKTILDVGANHADWSKIAKEIFKDSIFYLIEPQIEMEPHLKSFCESSPGSKYFLCGAGSANQSLTLTVWDDKAGSSFVPGEQDFFSYAKEKREVPIRTINTIISENAIEIPKLVKLDIQGFEIEALKGASDLFGNTEVFILEIALFKFEGMPVFSEVIAFMESKGYVLYDFAGFSRRPYDGALGQCDVVFAKKNGLLTQYQQWR